MASATTLEHDAQQAMGDHKVHPNEIAIGVVIGRASEYFDFFVFGIACVLVFPKVFFPFVDPLTGTLYAFSIFALAFIARPIGSVIFMAIDRRHGRSVKLTIALFLLGAATAAVSFLPRYDSIGISSVYILAVLRVLQGLALGGAWDGLASLLAMNAPGSAAAGTR
jgi:MFS family permease